MHFSSWGASSKSEGSLRRPIDCHGQEVERDPEQVEEGDGDEGRVRVEHVALYQERVKLLITLGEREVENISLVKYILSNKCFLKVRSISCVPGQQR